MIYIGEKKNNSSYISLGKECIGNIFFDIEGKDLAKISFNVAGILFEGTIINCMKYLIDTFEIQNQPGTRDGIYFY